MAAMDIRKARALAEQRIRSGQNNGLGLEDLVQQIIAESAGAPATAIGNALMVVPPRTVTPATPAPMQPGVQLVAPKPTAEMAPQRAASRPSRYQPELDRVRANLGVAQKAMSDAVAGGQKPNVADQIRLATLQEQADRLDALVRAEGSPEAEIPEEMRAALEGRQARLARREELLAEAKARSPWEALIAGGAALAQGRRGERFTEALTRGLQTGIMDYGRARRAGEEGADSIAEARDQALMDRYNMQERAREAARQRALEIMGIGEKAEERAVRNVRLPTQIGAEETAAELAKLNLKNAPEMAKLDRLVALARINASNREGGGEGKVDVEKRMATQALQGVADDYEGARTLYNEEIRAINASDKGKELTPEQKVELVTPEVRNAYIKAKAILESRSRAYDRIYGSSPFIKGQGRGAPSRTAITAAPSGVINLGKIGKPGR
jgi:hypothetical protein